MSSKVIDPNLKQLFGTMPGAWGCKDLDSVFLYGNEEYGQLIGLNHHEDVIGRTDFDMPCDTVNCAQLFVNQDKKVIQTLKKMRILDIHPYSGGQWKAYIFTKTPLLDNNKEVIGTLYHGADITNSSLLELGALMSRYSCESVKNDFLSQGSILLDNNFHDIKLTKRQSEVLFYLLRGKTNKKISLFLKISERTVEDYIEQLKFKFNAQNKFELIDIAIANGFLNTIPESLFRRQLSLELKF